MESGKLVDKAICDLGVTAGPWPLEYDGSLVIGCQVCIHPDDAGPDGSLLAERKANIRLFAWSRELYGKLDQLTAILETLVKGDRIEPVWLELAIAESRLLLAAPKKSAPKKGGGL